MKCKKFNDLNTLKFDWLSNHFKLSLYALC